jgi:TatD DNase family protein
MMLRLVDVHCHLESDYFKDTLGEVIKNAKNAGILKLITSSINPEQWELSRSISASFEEVEFANGVHPWYCRNEDIEKLKSLYNAKEIGAIAIGEIGLDTKIDRPGLELQKIIFESQLRIAKDIDLPVIIHCRGAFNELLYYIKKIGMPTRGGIIHSFSGSVEIAEEYMKHNINFSFGGALTFRNSKKKADVLKKIYPEHVLLETDSPDIPPVEAREMPNVPSNIIYNLRALSEILGIDEHRIAETTTQNAIRVFKLDI